MEEFRKLKFHTHIIGRPTSNITVITPSNQERFNIMQKREICDKKFAIWKAQSLVQPSTVITLKSRSGNESVKRL